jgi:hypothetical protein
MYTACDDCIMYTINLQITQVQNICSENIDRDAESQFNFFSPHIIILSFLAL